MQRQGQTGLADIPGWVISAGLHAGLVTLAVIGLPEPARDYPESPPAIEIEFIDTIADRTLVDEPEPEQAPKQAPEKAPEEKTDPVEDTPKPQPVEDIAARAPDVAPDVPPEIVPPLQEPEPEAPEVIAPVPKPKPKLSEEEVERRKVRSRIVPGVRPKQPSRLKTSKLSALIDRAKKEEEEQQLALAKEREAEAAAKRAAEEAEKAKRDPFAGIRGKLAQASLIDALRTKLSRCWSFPAGAKDIETFLVDIRISLRPDGGLARSPEVIREAGAGSEFFRVYRDSALRAVIKCAPYTDEAPMLASEKYQIDFTFDGRNFGAGS